MSRPAKGRLLTSLPLRPPSNYPPVFLLPLCLQRRTFLSRFLPGRRKKVPRVDPDSAEFQKNMKKQQAKDEDNLSRGQLAPNSILSKQPAPRTTDRDPGDTEEKIKLWESLSPSAQKYLSQQALAQGWEGPSPRRSLPPLSTIRNALKHRDSIKRSDEGSLLQRTRTSVLRRGRLSRQRYLQRSERALASRSPFIKTSIKKLGPLARQIAGKKLTDAMVQMRFSKKKAARDVLRHLEYARNKSMVDEGMGLGKVTKNIGEAENVMEEKEKERLVGEREKREKHKEEPTVVVRDRKGKRRVVGDRSEVYIDQAWVGRGKWEIENEYRAKGKVNRLYKPYTSITVLLKEERTRLREAQERQEKRKRKPVWVPLPDRPVTAQRQYPLW